MPYLLFIQASRNNPMRVMRARVLILGCLLSAAIAAGLTGVTAQISPYSFMPSMESLSSYGFPASMLEPQGYFETPFLSPDAISSLTSALMPASENPDASYLTFMPGLSSGLDFPAMSGMSAFTSPASQIPMTSLLAFPQLQMPSMSLPLSQDALAASNVGASPSTANSYTEASNGKTITVKQGDIIHVQLPSRIDQGYIWNLSVTDGLNVTSTRMYPPEDANSISNTGEIELLSTQEWDIQALKPGTQYITAVYKRPWADGPSDRTYTLMVIVS